MTALNQLGKRVNSHVSRAGGTTCVIKCTGKGWKKKVMSVTEKAEI